MRPSQQQRPDVVREREAVAALQDDLDGEHLIFVDESGIERGMRSAYGYAPRHERCLEHAPFRVGRRTSLLGWLGLRGGRVVPFSGTVDGGVFARFVEHYLVPYLSAGDVVVWDNARIHGAEAVALVEAAGARVLWQPRYSPDRNAVEQAWSKLKERVRRLRADTGEELAGALSEAVESITSRDVAGWMRQCGYTPQPV